MVINQRRKDVYEGVGYGIDRWKSTRKESVQALEEDGWVIHDADGGLGHYRQVIEEAEAIALNGVELTASILVEIRTGGPFQIGFYSSAYHCPDAAPLSAGIHLLTYTATMTDITSTLQYFISPRATNAKIIACQLEPGNQQTLAHKNASGAWVLNNPTSNIALELLKCQRYFQRLNGNSQWMVLGFALTDGTDKCKLYIPLCTTMRSSPSISFHDLHVNDATIMNISTDQFGTAALKYSATLSKTVPTGVYPIKQNGDGFLDLSSDL